MIGSNEIAALANNQNIPIEERIQLVNDQVIKDLMDFFQATKLDPDEDFARYADAAGKQVDEVFKKFQLPMQEYFMHKNRIFLDNMYEQEKAQTLVEQRVVLTQYKTEESSPYPEMGMIPAEDEVVEGEVLMR